MNDYYKKRQLIAEVDRKGEIIGPIEKWEAHKKGILHKGLTIALTYKGNFLLQHRKHPAFDQAFDITSSTHQLFLSGGLQTSEEAAIACLKREWDLQESDIAKLKNHGSIYYKSKDSNSIYTEHEICDIFTVEVKKLPMPNFDFAHGFSLVKRADLKNKKSRIYEQLTPWVKVAIEKNKL